MMFRSKALTDAARDQTCVNCGACDGTIVHAHSNEGRDGKGGAQKAHDCFGAWLCARCHDWADHGNAPRDPTGVWDDRLEFMVVMGKRTLLQWFLLGIVVVRRR